MNALLILFIYQHRSISYVQRDCCAVPWFLSRSDGHVEQEREQQLVGDLVLSSVGLVFTYRQDCRGRAYLLICEAMQKAVSTELFPYKRQPACSYGDGEQSRGRGRGRGRALEPVKAKLVGATSMHMPFFRSY